MKKLLLPGVLLLGLLLASCSNAVTKVSEKIYIAIEGEGSIAVMDRSSNTVIKRIPLKDSDTNYMPHNVQVAPDGKSVWVTANVMDADMQHSFLPVARANEAHHGGGPQDQVVIIDPATDTITKRLSLGNDLHLAHVVLTPDSKKALVAAQTKGILFMLDTSTLTVESTAQTTTGAEPHGLRIAPDGKTAYIALLQGKGVGIYDIPGKTLREEKLQGASVQTAVTPDGKYAFVSQYDTKSIAILDIGKNNWEYIALPAESKGPLQLYPTPDSQFVYVADQGNYFGQPDSNKVYKLSVTEKKITATITAGQAPHGIVVSKDGKNVYVTNLVSNDISVIETATDREVAKIPVGVQPNGISIWSPSGGTQ